MLQGLEDTPAYDDTVEIQGPIFGFLVLSVSEGTPITAFHEELGRG